MASNITSGMDSDSLGMTRQSDEFARNRVKVHLARFNRLHSEIEGNRIDETWLGDLEWRDNIFPEIDYRIYGGE